MVAIPSEGHFSTKPQTLSRGSRDSGIGTEPSHYDDPPSPGEKRLGTPDGQYSSGHGRRKSSGGSGTERVGDQFRESQNLSKPVYPRRVLEGGDIDMEDDPAPAVQDHFPGSLTLGQCSIASSSAFDSRPDCSESISSQADTEMDRSEGYDTDEEDEIEHDDSDSEMTGMRVDNADAAVQAFGQRVFVAAAHGGSWDICDHSSDSEA
jgi:hypothetical protein